MQIASTAYTTHELNGDDVDIALVRIKKTFSNDNFMHTQCRCSLLKKLREWTKEIIKKTTSQLSLLLLLCSLSLPCCARCSKLSTIFITPASVFFRHSTISTKKKKAHSGEERARKKTHESRTNNKSYELLLENIRSQRRTGESLYGRRRKKIAKRNLFRRRKH